MGIPVDIYSGDHIIRCQAGLCGSAVRGGKYSLKLMDYLNSRTFCHMEGNGGRHITYRKKEKTATLVHRGSRLNQIGSCSLSQSSGAAISAREAVRTGEAAVNGPTDGGSRKRKVVGNLRGIRRDAQGWKTASAWLTV